MSQTKAQILNPINGNLNVSGIITASSFVGNISGNTTVGGALTVTGNFTVNGTQTIINTQTLDITDKNIGIGSTSTPSDSLADGAGITVYGTTNKTLTWDNSNTRMAFSTNLYAPKYYGDGSQLSGISSVSFATTSFGLSGSPAILVSSVGINTTTTNNTKLYLQGNAASNIVGLGSTTATTTLDFSQGNNFSLTLGATINIANPTGVTTGQSGIILIQEDGTGGYTVGWGTSWDFASATAPTLTTTASALNALPYFARSTTSIVVGSVIAGIGTL